MKRCFSHWAFFALASAFCFAIMAGCVRLASTLLPQAEVVFFRNFISLLLLLPLAFQQKVSFKTAHVRLHLLRTAAGLTAMFLYFFAISHLPLADAVLLNYTSPIFVALFAGVWLKETLSWSRKLAVAIGVVGVLCLFHPSAEIASLAGLCGLISGVLGGLALTTVKRLSDTEPGIRIVLHFSFWSSLFSALPLLWDHQVPTPAVLLLLIGLASIGTVGQLLLAHAYKLAPASQVSPLGFSGLVFAGLIGFAFWGEVPDTSMLIGTAFIVCSGILVVRERAEPMPTPPSAAPYFPIGKND